MENSKVPKLPHSFFKWYCREDRYEEIHGDMEEFYYKRVQKLGKRKAELLYFFDVVRGCQPYAWKKTKRFQKSLINTVMLVNHFKTSFRTLSRNKLYSTINVLGLSIGIVCSMVIFLIIKTETNFDTFHAKKDRIYRVVTHLEGSNGKMEMAASLYPLAKTLLNDFPDLEQAVVTHNAGHVLVSVADSASGVNNRYQEAGGIGFTQSAFFEVFDFELIEGDKETVLSKPNSVALSESSVKRYFGEQNPLGKIITLDNTLSVEVNGVYKDFPDNTDIPFHTMLVSFESLTKLRPRTDVNDWKTQLSNIQTYILLPENSYPEALEEQLIGFVDKYIDLSKYSSYQFFLQPLEDIHMDARYASSQHQPVSTTALNSLMLIGFFIIVTACINFINLSTAQSLKRGKTIGIRKVLGSDKWTLVVHFIVETSIIVLVAVIISLTITGITLETLQQHIDFSAPIAYNLSTDLIVFVSVIFFVTVLISGLYPALIISRFKPLQVIKGNMTKTGASINVRKTLIVLQFVISQALIIGVIVVSQQISFFTNSDLGFNANNIIQIPLPEMDVKKMNLFKNEVSKSPLIASCSFSMAVPMTGGDLSAFFDHPESGTQGAEVVVKFGDVDFLKTYGIQLIAGRTLRNTDSLNNLLVNETFVKKININHPLDVIGKKIKMFGKNRTIVGVVKDFNSENFRQRINPLLIGILPSYYFTGGVKIANQDISGALDHIQSSWEKIFPEYVYDFNFYEQSIGEYYAEEQRTSNLFSIFSIISIFISCIGLYGLVTFMVDQRMKEIGIRKVLGASVTNIVGIFSGEFLKLIFIALLIASPIAWLLMDQWLADFVYRITITPVVFFVAGSLTIVFTIFSVGYKFIGVAQTNPVDVLSNE